MDRSVVMRGCVGGPDVAEWWCWANVVFRGQASDHPDVLDIRKPSYPRLLRPPSPQAEVRKNLSTSPLEEQPGQVDRLVSALSDQEQSTGKPIVETFPVEDAVCVARAWTEALAAVDLARPPADVPLRRWLQLIDDIGRFVDSGFGKKAAALRWKVTDLFGCDREKPFARIDRQGLCWLIAGNRIIDLSEAGAIIETWTGTRQTWLRKPSEPNRVLPWELSE
jgi:hypothetical protein